MSINSMDPVEDESFPDISEMDPSLPVPDAPEETGEPLEADQPEPEQLEVTDGLLDQ